MTAVTPVASGVGLDSHQATNITTQTTTLVKASPGTLKRIVINKATANGVITIRDHNAAAAAGTVKGIITSPGTLLGNHVELNYDMLMSSGIVIVTATADQDITVIWD